MVQRCSLTSKQMYPSSLCYPVMLLLKVSFNKLTVPMPGVVLLCWLAIICSRYSEQGLGNLVFCFLH